MKISTKVQILALAFAILLMVLAAVVFERAWQADAARLEETLDVMLTARPSAPETTAPLVQGPQEREPIFSLESAVIFEDLAPEQETAVIAKDPEIDDAELEMLACVIYSEAGGNACSDLCRMMVADVVWNRMADPRFPDTMKEVLTQEGQYGEWYWTGIQWPERASYPNEAEAVARAYDIAKHSLLGLHSDIFEQGYVWEAEFSQGYDVIALDGLYFGR